MDGMLAPQRSCDPTLVDGTGDDGCVGGCEPVGAQLLALDGCTLYVVLM